MANWKFTDDYGTAFPGLLNSVLGILVFSDHNISGNTFTGTLDFAQTGVTLNLAAQILNVTSLDFTGSLSTDANTFTLSLASNGTLTAQTIPIIGPYIQSVSVTIDNETDAADDDSAVDAFDLNLTMQNGSVSGTFITQIPLSYGSFAMSAVFENVGISFSDLDFLLPSGTDFGTYFPSDNPFIKSLYSIGTTPIYLLEIDLSLYAADKSGSLSFSVQTLTVQLGLINIPLYQDALFLNPLAVSVSFNNLPSLSSTNWSIYGTLALYPYASQTNPPTVSADFSFTVGMSIPIGTTPFAISGTFENEQQLPVSTLLQDLLGSGTSIGAADDIIITKFDIDAAASPSGGAISSFAMDIGLASEFGLFATPEFGILEFGMAMSYTQN